MVAAGLILPDGVVAIGGARGAIRSHDQAQSLYIGSSGEAESVPVRVRDDERGLAPRLFLKSANEGDFAGLIGNGSVARVAGVEPAAWSLGETRSHPSELHAR